jgi:hypothetical protein
MAWTQKLSWQKTFKKINEEIGFKGKLSCLRKTIKKQSVNTNILKLEEK